MILPHNFKNMCLRNCYPSSVSYGVRSVQQVRWLVPGLHASSRSAKPKRGPRWQHRETSSLLSGNSSYWHLVAGRNDFSRDWPNAQKAGARASSVKEEQGILRERSHLLDELVDLGDALIPVGAESVVALPDVFRL